MTDLLVTPGARAEQEPPPAVRLKPKKRTWRQAIRRDWQLYSLVLAPILFFLLFRYLPLFGNILAFRERFRPGGNLFGDGDFTLRWFERLWDNRAFLQALENTVILGALLVIVIFPLPIILALMLNELRGRLFKRFVQSVSYLPHFLSIVVVASMVVQFVSLNGMVNQIVGAFGGEAIPFMQRAEWYRTIFVTSEVWQTVGWGTILYLAALTTIDDDLYEAARIDGAGRWRQTWHVTLPGIRPMMITLLILNIGTFLNVSFEKALLLLNPLTYETGQVLSTYLFQLFRQSPNLLPMATAIGLFEAVLGVVLIVSANIIARRTVGTSLW
jgi:putative aldouronate transport system permease protein